LGILGRNGELLYKLAPVLYVVGEEEVADISVEHEVKSLEQPSQVTLEVLLHVYFVEVEVLAV
jgi:hypothetical protein